MDYLKSLIESLEEGTCAGILLYGPPGTGKTLLAISLANAFKASYYIIDGSPDLDRRDIEGYWELMKGDTRFNYGPLTMAIKDANEHGLAFVIINEINAIRENEQISLNSLLSENHINLISKGFERHQLNPNCKLIIIGTMNKGIIGINKLQVAFDDRFIVSPEITYPLKNKEIEITSEVSGCTKKIAEIVVDAARQIRKQAIQDFTITKIFSTRLIVNFCTLISKMPPRFLKNNIEHVIINKLGDNPEEKKSIAMILDGKMFESKLKKEILGEEESFNISEENHEKPANEDVINKLKKIFTEYIKRFGKGNVFRKNGHLMWKSLEWLWYKNRRILQDYFKLTENTGLPLIYKHDTGKNHNHNGNITLKYIHWLYKQKPDCLSNFMKKSYPVF